jgi:hypothetical protein
MRLGFGKFKLSSGGGAKVFPPVSKENSFGTNGSSVFPVQCSNETPTTSNTLLPENLLSKGKNAEVALEDPVATSDLKRCRSPGRNAHATIARSDGESSEGQLQQSPPPSSHREVSTQITKEAFGALGNSSHS